MENQQFQQTNINQSNSPIELIKKGGIKFGLSIAIVVICLVATGVAVYWWQLHKFADSYYNDLYIECRDSCCKKSVETMAAGNYKQSENGCPDGFQKNMLLCITSYEWCQSKTDETVNWQTYQNDEYRFNVKYPLNWEVKENLVYSPSILISPKDANDTSFFMYFDGTGAESVFQGNNCDGIKEVLLAGREAKECIFNTDNEYGKYIKITQLGGLNWDTDNELGYSVSVSEKELILIYEQILSTFKFIEPIDTSTWQTYRNKQYNGLWEFEIKYPDTVTLITGTTLGSPVEFDGLNVDAVLEWNNSLSNKCEIGLGILGWGPPFSWQKTEEDSLISQKKYTRTIWRENNNIVLVSTKFISNSGGTFGIDLLPPKSGNDECLSLYNQILSTFKFTK